MARGRLESAHVAGVAFGLFLAVVTALYDRPVLYLVTGICLGVGGVAGLASGGAFFLRSSGWRFMRYWMCLPFVAGGLAGVIIGVGRLAGWLD